VRSGAFYVPFRKRLSAVVWRTLKRHGMNCLRADNQSVETRRPTRPRARTANPGEALLRFSSLALLLVCGCSQSVAAQTNLVTLAPDGAYTWFNNPRALFHNGTLYFGYNSSDGKTALSAYHPATGSTLLWTSTWTEADDHNIPGLLPMEDGRLLAVYAHHGSTTYFNYRTSFSTNPIAPGAWSAESLFNTAARVTYSNPNRLSTERGVLYNFLRDLNFNPTVTVSTNGGTNWLRPRILIQTGSNSTVRPYVKYDSDYKTRIDFLYTDGHPNRLTNSLYHMYYRSGALRHTDGSVLKSFTDIPLLHDAGERGSIVYQYSDAAASDPNDHICTGRAWCWEIVCPTNGYPACVFSVHRTALASTNWFDDRIFYYYARWTGASWQKRFIAHAGRPIYSSERDYAGGICIDPQHPDVIYISSNAARPFDLTNTTDIPLSDHGHYEIFRGVTINAGLTFSWTAVTSNSTVDNLRPYVPRNHPTSSAVMWFRGAYSSYTTYRCGIVGLF